MIKPNIMSLAEIFITAVVIIYLHLKNFIFYFMFFCVFSSFSVQCLHSRCCTQNNEQIFNHEILIPQHV